MIKQGKDLRVKYCKLTKSEYKQASELFNMNNWWLVKQYVNDEIIDSLYGW